MLRNLLSFLAQLTLAAALAPCGVMPTFKETNCPEGTLVACWSRVDGVNWACEQPLASATTTADWNGLCKGTGTPPGSSSPLYDGACTYQAVATTAIRSWDEAKALALKTLAVMTPDEKISLLQGVGWHWVQEQYWYDLSKGWYVGNTPAIPRLGIPSLNMEDAASGFRTYWKEITGTVTVWPSLLCIAATWDPDAVRDFAIALGQEFAAKGANVILGPSVQVHRVALGGRNFEYIAGEDPYLGSVLAPPYVEGVQSQGVMAVMKHWIFNDQETNRGSQSSIVDSKTAWELYYPPFQASIDAGVGAAMCSYNKVDGIYSCSNKEQFDILKNRLGFEGFVQSDWWASHNLSIAEGLDQEMPGIGPYNAGVFFNHEALTEVHKSSPQVIDESARRILAAIYKLNLGATAKCTPPNCQDFMFSKVTSDAHLALARRLAREAVVVLKNDKTLLPIDPRRVKKIAIVGKAADTGSFDPNGVGQSADGGDWATGDYFSGGGSGHLAAADVVTPLEGLSSRAKTAGISVVSSPSNDLQSALSASNQADVTLVIGGTSSGESRDRSSLHLDGGFDDLVFNLASSSSCKNIIVVAMAPGTILMPWKDVASGILLLLLGGSESGAALADIIFGDQPPTGRLPLMIPLTEDDTVRPGLGDDVVYSEGMRTSYRNPNFKAAFPFGFGLSFTNFTFTAPVVVPCPASAETGRRALLSCISIQVTNTGSTASRAVPQLYLELPSESGWPVPLLKGFKKTSLLPPQQSEEVTFQLTVRDCSYFDAVLDDWVQATSAIAHIGESQASLPFTLSISLPPPRGLSTKGVASPQHLRGAALP